MKKTSKGVVFVATGDSCRKEVLSAIHFMQKFNSNIKMTLFTDDINFFNDSVCDLDSIICIDNPSFSFIDKIFGFINAPYDKNIFMDSDTGVVDDISDLFDLLDRVDIAAAHAGTRDGKKMITSNNKTIPSSFPELNTGIVCFKKNNMTKNEFLKWKQIYIANPSHINDQPSFREMLFFSDLSFSILPPEFNFLASLSSLSGKVRIFHSPKICLNHSEFTLFSDKINEFRGVRTYIPNGQIIKIH